MIKTTMKTDRSKKKRESYHDNSSDIQELSVNF